MDPIALRAPGRALTLTRLLSRVIPDLDEPGCQHLLDTGAASAGERRLRSAVRNVAPGTLIRVDAFGLDLRPEPDPDSRDGLEALVPAPAWPAGRLQSSTGVEIAYRVQRVRGGVAELVLHAPGSSAAEVLDALAGAGWPVLGDGRRGGILIEGGPRIRAAAGDTAGQAREETTWWPDEPVFEARPDDEKTRPVFRVSGATARALLRGHPWVLPDDESDEPARLAPGTLVRLQDPQRRELGEARIEGPGPVAARVWWPAGQGGPSPGVAERVAAALERRRALQRKGSGRSLHRGQPHTDAIRLIHGEADGLPGLAVDRLGPLLRVLVQGRAALGLVERVVGALLEQGVEDLGGTPPVVEVIHLRAAPPGRHQCVRLLSGAGAVAFESDLGEDGSLVVHERGLRFRVDVGLGEPERPRPGTGLYLDQRENRERLAGLARGGGRWLNLFAHTGAFSVALLAAGAEQVTSVDLSAPYLRWLEANLDLNRERGVDAARHVSVRRDGRRHLGALPRGERFDGIVLDPPTAAAAGRRFWSAARDLEPLVAEALSRLSARGVLLVCRNERRARRPLTDVVRKAAQSAGVRIGPQREAGPGGDFPHLAGFAEGDSFQGVIVQRD